MVELTEKQIKFFKFFALFGLFYILIGTVNNFILGVDHEPFTKSLLYPYTNFLVPGANITCAVLVFIYMVFPKQVWLIFVSYFIETLNLILTGFQFIGVLVYINALAFAFTAGLAQIHFKRKAFLSLTLLFCMIGTIFFEYGLADGWIIGLQEWLYTLGMAVFFISCYVSFYCMISDKISYLLGDFKVPDIKCKMDLPEKGSDLNLKSFGFSERQISIINYSINSSLSYKRIADKLLISESTVKKEMSSIYDSFGVKNKEMLRMVLVQYNII